MKRNPTGVLLADDVDGIFTVRSNLIDYSTNRKKPSKLPIRIEVDNQGVTVKAEGYGDAGTVDGEGAPVFLEWYDGRLWLRVWADINSEDPTHNICLEGARESARRAE